MQRNDLLLQFHKSLRRIFAICLACLMLALSIPLSQPAKAAADPLTTKEYYEWNAVRTQADLPTDGEYHPMLLICNAENPAQARYMTGHKMECEHNLYVDGYGESQSNLPPCVKERYSEWLLSAGYPDDNKHYSSKYYQEWFNSPGTTHDDMVHCNRWWSYPCTSDWDCNTLTGKLVTDCPELAISSDSFITKTMPTDWELKVTSDDTRDGMHYVNIRSGDRYLNDGVGWWGMAEMQWEKSPDKYLVYTADDLTSNSRYDYTLNGYVQLYYRDTSLGGINSVLAWDGDLFGTVESNTSAGSNFKMYIGRKVSINTIDQDYVVPAGSILYAPNNLEILPNVNLIIAPGGVLSVSGDLFNNGYIHNCGTVILNPNTTIRSLEPNKDDTGSVYCYGGNHISFSLQAWSPYASAVLPYFGMNMTTLGEQMATAKFVAAIYSAVLDVSRNDLTADQIEFYESMIAEYGEDGAFMEEVYNYRNEHPDDSLEDFLYFKTGVAETGYKNYSFAKCEGNLIIMEDAALVLPDKKYSYLNLLDGATCANNGSLVLPHGFTAQNAELINRKDGHIFIGYSFSVSQGAGASNSVHNPGTEEATLAGLGPLNDKDHVIRLSDDPNLENAGTIKTYHVELKYSTFDEAEYERLNGATSIEELFYDRSGHFFNMNSQTVKIEFSHSRVL